MSWLLTYLYNALWQVPLLTATAWLAARLLRRESPARVHRVWVAGLIGSTVLPAFHLPLGAAWTAFGSLLSPYRGADSSSILVTLGHEVPYTSGLQLPAAFVVITLVVWLATGVWLTARLAHGIVRTSALVREAKPVVLTDEMQARFVALGAGLGLATLPSLAQAAPIAAPVTIRFRRPLILLPPDSLAKITAVDLEAVLAHELAHIARRDFAKNLFYRTMLLPIAWHPCVWILQARIAETRELTCDAMAAAAVAGRRQYARSLLRLALLYGDTARRPMAVMVGILDCTSNHALERRVMTLNRVSPRLGVVHRIILTIACSGLAFGVCTSALALHTNIDSAGETKPAKTMSIPANVMSGNKISDENPVYPIEARKKRIQGKVVLNAKIGTDGAIHHVEVVESPSKLLSDSARKAVETWKYRPYLMNGNPVTVDTSINVIYSLGK